MINVVVTQSHLEQGTINSLAHGPLALACRDVKNRDGSPRLLNPLVGLHTLRYQAPVGENEDGTPVLGWFISALPIEAVAFQQALAVRDRHEILEIQRVMKRVNGEPVTERFWHSAQSFSIPDGVLMVNNPPLRKGRKLWGSNMPSTPRVQAIRLS